VHPIQSETPTVAAEANAKLKSKGDQASTQTGPPLRRYSRPTRCWGLGTLGSQAQYRPTLRPVPSVRKWYTTTSPNSSGQNAGLPSPGWLSEGYMSLWYVVALLAILALIGLPLCVALLITSALERRDPRVDRRSSM